MAPPEDRLKRRNDLVFAACAVFVAVMVGASFAAVPLYRMFCQLTGFAGTTRVAKAAPGAVGDAVFTIRFDTNVAPGLPWAFEPEERSVTVKVGEQKLVFFRATNRSAKRTVGSATFNVQPDTAGIYFNKIACFCFNEQPLASGQVAEMPVSFFVDPAILKEADLAGVRTITLSYTFFPAADAGAKLSAREPVTSSQTSAN